MRRVVRVEIPALTSTEQTFFLSDQKFFCHCPLGTDRNLSSVLPPIGCGERVVSCQVASELEWTEGAGGGGREALFPIGCVPCSRASQCFLLKPPLTCAG